MLDFLSNIKIIKKNFILWFGENIRDERPAELKVRMRVRGGYSTNLTSKKQMDQKNLRIFI